MAEYSIYQVDAFSGEIFRGNPAAVVPLADWLEADLLQAIAMENNLSETAFFTRVDHDEADFHLRWFTPKAEVDLCGHATLAAAHVLFNELDWYAEKLRFTTETAGLLQVIRRADGRLQLDFPARPGDAFAIFDDFVQALGARPAALYLSRDHMAVFTTAAEVAAIEPDLAALARINRDGVIVTAPADATGVDFVSRYFAPAHGIAEDPVTGSAHCTLVPYWAEKLGKTTLIARQISPRGGEILCDYLADSDRVHLSGQAVTYMQGTIFV